MPVFLNTSGNPTLGVGICDRCRIKMPLHMLHSDPNYPGLKVCDKDRDDYDPYRLPARQPEKIALPFVRLDRPLDLDGGGEAVADDGDDFIVYSGDEL